MAPGDLLTVDAQIEWRGTVLGGLSPYGWDDLTGWYDLPEQRGSNAALPGYHGSFPGRRVSGDRVITYDYKSRATSLAAFKAAMDTLRRITAPAEDPPEEPLVVRLDGVPLLAWARCDRRVIPTGRQYGLGRADGSIQWTATDPRLYSVTEKSASANLATPGSSGVDFSAGGLDFGSGGLDFGSGQQGGVLTATNSGHVPTWPTIEIVGPCTGPIVTFPGGRQLRFRSDFVILAGQTLVIDTRPTWRTPEIADVAVGQHLQVRQWTALQPATPTQITFGATAYDSASELIVKWRDAWH
ncbi:hypothetical protein SUDANB95_05523 [Actinosynnema sp. ALI-1.44]